MPDRRKQNLSPEFLAKRWKPGQSGNPNGRPKRPSFEAIVAEVLDEKLAGFDETKRKLVARVFVDEMLKRNASLLRSYLDRAWPAPQRHEVSGVNGGPVTLADFVQLARADYEPCPCSNVPTACGKADLDADNPCAGCDGPEADDADVASPIESAIPEEEVGVEGRIVLRRNRDE